MTTKKESAEETQLLVRCRQNDGEAFGQLVERHAGKILNLAHRMLDDAMEAEDLMQETFLAAWRSLPQFRAEARFSTWLYRIAVNKCKDRLRSRKPDDTADLDEGTLDLDNLVVDMPTPEKELSRKETANSLEHALQALPVPYREAFVLKHIEGLSYEEMSEVLGFGADTLKMRVYKARVRLRAKLASLNEAG